METRNAYKVLAGKFHGKIGKGIKQSGLQKYNLHINLHKIHPPSLKVLHIQI